MPHRAVEVLQPLQTRASRKVKSHTAKAVDANFREEHTAAATHNDPELLVRLLGVRRIQPDLLKQIHDKRTFLYANWVSQDRTVAQHRALVRSVDI